MIEEKGGKRVVYSDHITLDRLVNIAKNKKQHSEQFTWNFKAMK